MLKEILVGSKRQTFDTNNMGKAFKMIILIILFIVASIIGAILEFQIYYIDFSIIETVFMNFTLKFLKVIFIVGFMLVVNNKSEKIKI